jgi:predicted pyridoxine 5'-phosphate oxidase superfamily flavin-nucleotide-binding protein
VTGSPFHAGELEAQVRAGGGPPGANIRAAMPDQHRRFYATLPFVAVGTRAAGWPVATVLEGPPGFVSSPDPETLRVAVRGAHDPAVASFVAGGPFGMLGIDLATRRRNRVNGVIAEAGRDGWTIDVKQAFGNCPQYIHVREASRGPAGAGGAPVEATGLDEAARAQIARADTFFVATAARVDEAVGGVDVSHRGGPRGFVRVEGDQLTIPDYRGNRYFNTLGNLVSDPRAALVFLDFDRGDLLQVSGTTEIVWDGPEVRTFLAAERLWRLKVRRAWRLPAALSLRWSRPM